MNSITRILVAAIILLFLNSCTSENDSTPRPRGYFRIDLGKHTYKAFDPTNCPFTFQIPTHGYPIQDTNSVSEPCWYYILLPDVNGQLYLTYKTLHSDLDKYAEDTRTLVYKHTAKASSIDEEVVEFSPGVNGVVYEIGGNAASALQFYVTDSTTHFLRGALYFNTAPNADSLKPVLAYVKEDIKRMLSTLRWR